MAVTSVASTRQVQASGVLEPRSAKLRGVVTGFSGWKNSFFLQDGTGAISVDRLEQTTVRVGDEVEVTGNVQPGLFAPILLSNTVDVLGAGILPKARVSTYYDLARGKLDSQWVEVSGIVHSARVGEMWGRQVLFLDLRSAGGEVTVHVINFRQQNYDDLIDSAVQIRGICGTVFNDRQQLLGVRLFIPDLKQVVLESPRVAPESLPLAPLRSLLRFNPDASLEHRVRIAGTVTFRAPGVLYLQSNGAGIRVESREQYTFELGETVEAYGFVVADGYSPSLDDAIVHAVAPGHVPAPIAVQAAQVITAKDGFDFASYDGLLVHIEGKIIERLPRTHERLWLVEEKLVQFQTELDQMGRNDGKIEPGSYAGLTGICRIEVDGRRNPKSFRILLRSTRDITVLRTSYSTVSGWFLGIALAVLVGGALLIPWLHLRKSNASAQTLERTVPESRSAAFGRASKIIALMAGGLGVLVLVGWKADIQFLKSIQGGYAAMKPNAAVGFVAAGLALWLANGKGRKSKGRATLAYISTAITVGLGGFTLLEYATGLNLHIDQLLFPELGMLVATASPGRMALVTAFCFFLLGGALAVVRHPRLTALAQVLALVVGAFCMLSLNSYLYGIHSFEGIAVYAAMAVHTAGGLLLLSLGIVFCYVDRGPMKSIVSLAPGGAMATRLVPGVLLLPSILGWMRWQGQLDGFYDTAFGLALFTSVNAVCLSFLIWSLAAHLNRVDQGRSEAEAEVRGLNETLEARVVRRTAELNHSEQRFRSIIDAVKDYSIITLDPDGNVATWNSGAERQEGYKAEEIIGKHFSTFYSSKNLENNLPAEELRTAESAGVCHQEGWRTRKDGRVFWAEVLITAVLNDDGSLRGFSKITHDTTDRKTAAAALLEARSSLELRVAEQAETNKELAQKNEEVEAFVYIVSHDLRTPLVNLQGFCKELELSCDEIRANFRAGASPSQGETRIQTILNEDIPGALHYINASTSKFHRLINALLDLSRYGRQEYHPEELDLDELVQSTLDLMRLSLAAGGVRVSLNPMPSVDGDATAVGQVFSNLIGNSIKYLQPGRPGHIEIGGELEEGTAHCWVRDNGAGLPAGAKAQLFQVFRRFHPELAQGEGMGLAVVKRIVERHGGRIWAESEENVGSTFHFTLPCWRVKPTGGGNDQEEKA